MRRAEGGFCFADRLVKTNKEWCYEKHGSWWSVDDYFTDIAACVRAAEAWKTEDFNYRRYYIESVLQKTGVYEAIVSDLGDAAINVTVFAGTPSAALASALVEAVK